MRQYVPRRANTQKRLREIEEMRASLPLGKYLQLIHIAATTGVIPNINPLTGEPTVVATTIEHQSDGTKRKVLNVDGSILEPGQRLNLLQYLVDKQMPALKGTDVIETESTKVSEQVIDNPTITPHLSSDELDSVIEEAEFYVPRLVSPRADPPPDSEPEDEAQGY